MVVVVLLSIEVLVIGRLDRLLIRVWKFSSVFRWFWEIFGWYGV